MLPPLGTEDEDVARERDRVKNGRTVGDILVLTDLSKVQNRTEYYTRSCIKCCLTYSIVKYGLIVSLQVYKAGRKPAVNRLCLGIPRGEVSRVPYPRTLLETFILAPCFSVVIV